MPAPARLITLNLGSQTLGLAEFRVAHGGLTLVDYRLRGWLVTGRTEPSRYRDPEARLIPAAADVA